MEPRGRFKMTSPRDAKRNRTHLTEEAIVPQPHIHALPRELLEEILVSLLPCPMDVLDHMQQVHVFRETCRVWSRVVDTSNRLGCAVLNISRPQAQQEIQLQRFGDRPLIVVCTPGQMPCSGEHVASWYIPLAVANCHRWKAIAVCRSAILSMPQATIPQAPMPFLKAAAFSGRSFDLGMLAQPSCTTIQSLHLLGTYRLTGGPSLAHITLLRLTRAFLSGTNLTQFLALFPSLVSLTYWSSDPGDDFGIEDDVKISPGDRLPKFNNLRCLELHCMDARITETVVNLVARDKAPMEEISLVVYDPLIHSKLPSLRGLVAASLASREHFGRQDLELTVDLHYHQLCLIGDRLLIQVQGFHREEDLWETLEGLKGVEGDGWHPRVKRAATVIIMDGTARERSTLFGLNLPNVSRITLSNSSVGRDANAIVELMKKDWATVKRLDLGGALAGTTRATREFLAERQRVNPDFILTTTRNTEVPEFLRIWDPTTGLCILKPRQHA